MIRLSFAFEPQAQQRQRMTDRPPIGCRLRFGPGARCCAWPGRRHAQVALAPGQVAPLPPHPAADEEARAEAPRVRPPSREVGDRGSPAAEGAVQAILPPSPRGPINNPVDKRCGVVALCFQAKSGGLLTLIRLWSATG